MVGMATTPTPDPRAPRPCQTCGEVFTPRRRVTVAFFCSQKCGWKDRIRRTGIPCRICGEPTGWIKTDKRAPAEPAHNACLRSRHGTLGSYGRGCRCDECRAAAATAQRAYAAKVRERDGVNLYRKYRVRGSEDKFISRDDRLAIYERDKWTCQLCKQPVDPTLGPSDRMGPTLDHIVPRSATLFPDHSESNLQLAHRSCNSIKHAGTIRLPQLPSP